MLFVNHLLIGKSGESGRVPVDHGAGNSTARQYSVANRHTTGIESGLSAIVTVTNTLALSLSAQYATPLQAIQSNTFCDALYFVSLDKTVNQNMGRAKLVAGHDGKGIDLNGHDQWVEVYQDKNIEISGNELTVSLWIFPRDLMKTGGALLTKGNYQFGLQQNGANSLDFYIYTSRKTVVSAELPKDWIQNWHHEFKISNS